MFRPLHALAFAPLALGLLLTAGEAVADEGPVYRTATIVCGTEQGDSGQVAEAEPTAVWEEIVSTYVTADDGFRYEALLAHEAHRAALAGYTDYVAGADPASMERDARLAFLINAYNAYTVASVIELWPVEGVLQEDGFFDGRTHNVGGMQVTLNALENEHIRTLGEPRIHFAVNCASTGCPPLVATAYTAENLESLLDANTRAYVRAMTTVSEGTVQTSQIFEWFADDFAAAGGVRAFLATYLDEADAAAVRDTSNALTFVPYDWSLNGR